MVALEALSRYASLFYVKHVNLTATYRFNDDQISTGSLVMDNSNRIKVHTLKLTSSIKESNQLKLQVQGSGSIQAQVSSIRAKLQIL